MDISVVHPLSIYCLKKEGYYKIPDCYDLYEFFCDYFISFCVDKGLGPKPNWAVFVLSNELSRFRMLILFAFFKYSHTELYSINFDQPMSECMATQCTLK